jgi:hypothetical protein
MVVDAESFAVVTRTCLHVPEIGPRSSIPGGGGRNSRAGGQTTGE